MSVTRTRLGEIQGIESNGTITFLGIPFGAPPTGRSRWRPPTPAGRWSGIFDATQTPKRSFQLSFPTAQSPGEMSEDMLSLNVYTPAADRKRRAVALRIG